jgi:hypothetical protein
MVLGLGFAVQDPRGLNVDRGGEFVMAFLQGFMVCYVCLAATHRGLI